ncbi:S8 family serine peptidase [Nitrospira moscoviensis]|uniref:Peptidase S8 and S53 subtilisin kexin sedolisin n=1 Tax=Nitrospira moscoviensis TaxID=42253 RepID=A0A0K2GHR7_NITMO|nr:S8 family serine peptidase [Nitrospira moscoviensis]ALA60508.1 Peptidase S8 and S53 subtilisin kexin sedolisin [Nitrospira moscoviensis]
MKTMRPSVVLLFVVALSLAVEVRPTPAGDRGPTSPNDPFYGSTGTWGQPFLDQWYLRTLGFLPKGGGRSAWDIETGITRPVIVAVLDTGLDYYHPDIPRSSLWLNLTLKPGESPDGYENDVIGWNFVDHTNNPWDNDGHGTFVAGIIGAAADNGQGIAGINWGVKIMPLKVLNVFAHGKAFNLARAIVYAVDHGARILNLSIEGEQLTRTEQLAIDYAYNRGALIVVAAGNQASDTDGRGPAGLRNVLTVASVDLNDKRAPFSNWGKHVKIAAPGVDILSLRARRTDFNLLTGAEGYKAGESFVGPHGQFMRSSGTSFSAPMVSGVASLIWAKYPNLTNVQVERMLLESADDVEEPGWDNYTGAGRLNAVAALKADPNYFLTAKVSQVGPVKIDGKTAIQVSGSAVGSRLKSYELQLGQGETPPAWKTVAKVDGKSVEDGVLGTFPVKEITAKGKWMIRLVAQDGTKTKEARGTLDVK